jgi:hypothetical protein
VDLLQHLVDVRRVALDTLFGLLAGSGSLPVGSKKGKESVKKNFVGWQFHHSRIHTHGSSLYTYLLGGGSLLGRLLRWSLGHCRTIEKG